MMRSLFSGVSGLKNHQTRMDVIGNNISNVNTTGFKSSRVTFADMISQTLTGASAPTDTLGGTNPKQIGLGSAVSSIDLLFTNGSVQSTGKNTDLCLSGNGLFVMSNGQQQYYTRNGAFEFDAAGNYVQPGNGYYVMGWMAEDGKLPDSKTGSGMTRIAIKAGKSMEAAATSNCTYAHNLNAETKGYIIGSAIVKYADGTTETVTNYTPQPAGKMSLSLSTGETVDLDGSSGYPFTTGSAVNGKVLYTSKIDSVTATTSGTATLKLSVGSAVHSINGGTTYTPPALTSGTYKHGDKYTLSGTINPGGVTTAGAAPGNTKLTVTLSDGNVVTFEVPIPTGFTYADGQTVNFDFVISKITANTGAEVTTANGNKATLTSPLVVNSNSQNYTRMGTASDGTVSSVTRTEDGYAFNGKRVDSVTLQSKDGASLTGLVGANYAANGTFYPSLVSSVAVYDSEGTVHNVSVLITKTKANTWTMSLQGGGDSVTLVEKDGSKTTVKLEKKDLVFDTMGRYVSGDASLSLEYKNGAASPQQVALNFAGLTQYAGSNTVSAAGDGHAAGTLESVSVDTSGVITGTYTNGVKQTEAQVAVAQFNNASGLTKMGDSLYQESNNSGVANVKTAADLGCKITPSAIEMSNVDIANEFTDMIITQRGFQSNSKIITVSDEMLETLVNMKR